jgi:hypothetical protein
MNNDEQSLVNNRESSRCFHLEAIEEVQYLVASFLHL